MKERLLITTAIGLMLGTGAFAQSPSEQPRTNPKSDQFEFVGAIGVLVGFFAEFDAVCPERPIDAFRGS
jgi:hypothetical protein